MEGVPPPSGPNGPHDRLDPAATEWVETLTRTIAHLAAQLTISQIRLSALATELGERGTIDEAAVAARLRRLAPVVAGRFLRENLGAALVEAVDVDALERDLVAYLAAPSAE